MKKFNWMIAAAVSLALFQACGPEQNGPSFADDEIPYIYTESNSYISTYTNQPLEIVLFVVPSDGSVSCSWSLDGEVIATTPTLKMTVPDTPGQYALLFTATRNGIVNTRSFKLAVTRDPNEPEPEPEPGEGETLLKAHLAPMTKTAVLHDGKTVWEEGDEIAVLLSTGSFTKLTLESGAGTDTGYFRFTPEGNEKLGNAALYPYQEEYALEGNKLKVTLPETYSVPADATDPLLFAPVSGEEITFSHLFGRLRLELGAVPSAGAKVTVTAGGARLSGDYLVDLGAATPSAVADEAASSVITIDCAAPEKLGRDERLDILVPAANLGSVSIKVTNPDESLTWYSTDTALNIPAGGLAAVPLYPCIRLAYFEEDTGATGGDIATYYTVVDNPVPTELNYSEKVLYSSGIAGTEGAVPGHRININPSTGNSKIPGIAFRPYARAARMKVYMGEDAGKFIPWGRLAWKGYSLPSSVNGEAVTAANVASLFKAGEWNVVVWDYTIWSAEMFNANNFDMRPFCTPDSGDVTSDAAGERKIYYDDFELLF